MDPERERVEFGLKYEGRANEVSADTLLNTLMGITGIVYQASANFAGGAVVDVKVRAPARGSLILELVLDAQAQEALTTGIFEGIKVIGSLVGIVYSVLQIRKHLKKDPPAKVEDAGGGNIIITNSAGAQVTVDNRSYLLHKNNAEVAFRVNHIFESLDKDRSVDGFMILDEGKAELFRADRPDFPDLYTSTETVETQDHHQIVTQQTVLPIVKACFEPGKRWQFVYSAHIIGAAVTDQAFLERVARREEVFASGDLLDVDLRIDQDLDPVARVFVSKAFTVVKVHGHRKGPEQPGLFPPDNPDPSTRPPDQPPKYPSRKLLLNPGS